MSPSTYKYRRLFQVFPFVAIFLIWYSLAQSHTLSTLVLPSPFLVASTGYSMILSGTMWKNVSASLLRVLEGFTIGSTLGVAFGVAMGESGRVAKFLESLINALRLISPVALIPWALIFFPVLEEAVVFLIVWTVMFVTLINTYDAVRDINPIFLRAARSLGTTKFQEFYRISLPAAMPGIMTGLRIATGDSFRILVIAEVLGASSGLGYLIEFGAINFRPDISYIALVSIALLGYGFYRLAQIVQRRLIRWQP